MYIKCYLLVCTLQLVAPPDISSAQPVVIIEFDKLAGFKVVDE